MSIRDQVRGRALPSETVSFPADREAWARAHAELEVAAAAVQHALRRGAAAAPELLAAERAAQDVVDELPLHAYAVRTLSRDDWEALVAEHPATRAEDQAAGYDSATFFPALLEHTVTLATDAGPVSSTASEWLELFGSGELTPGEVNTLLSTALQQHTTATIVPPSVGKGSAQTRS